MNIVLNDPIVGLMTEYTVWYEIHDHEKTGDNEPLCTVTVIIKRTMNGTEHIFTPTISDEDQDCEEYFDLTDEEKKEIIDRVNEDIKNGVYKLPVSVDFFGEGEEPEFIEFF